MRRFNDLRIFIFQTIQLYFVSLDYNKLKHNNMIVVNKLTGRDVSSEYLAYMQGIITKDEFELITMTIK